MKSPIAARRRWPPGRLIGAEPIYPYQYEQSSSDSKLTGLYTGAGARGLQPGRLPRQFRAERLVSAIGDAAPRRIWTGSVWLIGRQREVFGHFSMAYLSLHYAVFDPTDSYRRLPGDPQELLRWLARISGVSAVAGPRLPRAGADLSERWTVALAIGLQPARSGNHGAPDQRSGRCVVFADELAGLSTVSTANRWIPRLASVPGDCAEGQLRSCSVKSGSVPRHAPISTQALLAMEADGTTAAIVRAYHYPGVAQPAGAQLSL